MKNLDEAFDNMAAIEGSKDYPQQWANQAERYRKSIGHSELNISYGNHEREVFDMFWPDSIPKGLCVFVHGGYWMRLDKSYWSHLAEGARKNGWAVAIPSYVLTPEATISQITAQIARAISSAAECVSGPIHLSGHSAGGHLVTRMICKNSLLEKEVLERINRVLAISGLFDLEPLLNTTMNQTLRLTNAEAKSESPYLLEPIEEANLTAWVGGDELPEFTRQAEALLNAWNKPKLEKEFISQPGMHHFSVIEGLADPESEITKKFLA